LGFVFLVMSDWSSMSSVRRASDQNEEPRDRSRSPPRAAAEMVEEAQTGPAGIRFATEIPSFPSIAWWVSPLASALDDLIVQRTQRGLHREFVLESMCSGMVTELMIFEVPARIRPTISVVERHLGAAARPGAPVPHVLDRVPEVFPSHCFDVNG
jgi:hypothetical protein